MNFLKITSQQSLLVIYFLIAHIYNSSSQEIFTKNEGQLPKHILSNIKIPSGEVFLEKGKITFSFYDQSKLQETHEFRSNNKKIKAHAYQIQFKSANKNSEIKFEEKTSFFENYYLKEKSSWVNKVSSYKKYCENDLYEGIDFKMYANKGNLKYEFIVAPNIEPNKIEYSYKGIEYMYIENKQLYIKTSINTIIEEAPYAYQIIEGVKQEIACEYLLIKNKIKYIFPEGYDKSYTLIIDPTLIFSTYSGSIANNFGYTATFDHNGFLYSGSTVFGIGYPVTLGAFEIDFSGGVGQNGGTDIAITKYDTTGSQRIYSTYLGGSMDELPHSMIANYLGELYLFGTTGSSDFPTTNKAYDRSFNGGYGFTIQGLGCSFPNGSDIFISKLNSEGGELLSSTFIGGSSNDGLNLANKLKINYADEVRGEIELDEDNNLYIVSCTKSIDFPISNNAFQKTISSGQEGCVFKMDGELTNIIWSSYLGGGEQDAVYSIAINSNNIYVTGGTNSSDFPTDSNSYQPNYLDSLKADAFISKISSNGNKIINSTFFGSNEYDQSYFIDIDSKGDIYIFGQTESEGATLVYNSNYFQPSASQFIAKFTSDLSTLKQSTVVGTGKGGPDISPTAFLVDVCKRVYFSGWGSSSANLGWQLSTLNLPTTTNAYQKTTDGHDFYLMVLGPNLDSLIYATYFGGSQSLEHVDGGTSRFDKKGIIYQCVCAGCGGYNDFPTTSNAISNTNNAPFPSTSGCNSAVFKFNMNLPMIIADFSVTETKCDGTIVFKNTTHEEGTTTYLWDFGDSTISNLKSPTHLYSENGVYNVTLISTSAQACNFSDTITKKIYVLKRGIPDTLKTVNKCKYGVSQIGIDILYNEDIDFLWTPSIDLTSNIIPNPYTATTGNIQYHLILYNNNCQDTIIQNVNINEVYIEAGEDTVYCSTPIQLTSSYFDSINIIWSSNKLFTDTLSFSETATINQTGTYYVMGYDSICYSIDSIEVVSKNIDIQIMADSIFCQGDTISIEVKKNNSTEIKSFKWTPEPIWYNNDSSLTEHVVDFSKWYTIGVTDIEGCKFKDSIFINEYSSAITYSVLVEDSVIYKGEETSLNIITEESIFWINNQSYDSNIVVKPGENTMYYFEVFNDYCTIRDSILIQVNDIFCNEEDIRIPTAFTPESNSLNNKYFISAPEESIIYFRLEIFNRLGQKVFKTTDINKKWNGEFRGKLLPPQVLDFYLDMKCVGEKKLFKKGNITLIR